jgi:hypothetical protein
MILEKKRSNLATLYPILENASLSIQYYFCLRSYLVMPINGNANDIITIPFDRDKTNITDDNILTKWRNYFK